MFEKFDTDGSGDINTKELGQMMNILSPNPIREELNAIIEKMDEDGSGTIDFKEFLVMMVRQFKNWVKKELAEIFRIFDM
ncbi:hypothetical protein chiPu_0011802 [Chiloscyllium punctatum]|uniref:Troponin C, skeletal muscle n=1 Tax=Chiloscyllium punctatum TaxID=137246 RepID=A0A401SSJ6_CHIPU|nr:hypothetical protein [Chiloscyllium punctatum]